MTKIKMIRHLQIDGILMEIHEILRETRGIIDFSWKMLIQI